MISYYIENKEEMPILALKEGIDYNYPFIIIEIIESISVISLKVRYANHDLNLVKLKYFKLIPIIINQMIVVNAYLSDITDNVNNIKKYIFDYYYEKKNI